MTIETKYSKGDRVWAIVDSKAIEFEIAQIKVSSFRGTFIGYLPYEHPHTSDKFISEDRCFPTKEELLKSL